MSEYHLSYLAKPQIPKTFGVLNILFGFILILFGLCGALATVFLPALGQFARTAQSKIDGQIDRQIKDIEAKEKTASTEAEKVQLRQRREALAQRPRPTIDMNLDTLNDPTIKAFTWFGLIVQLVISISMITTGIGLFRLRDWGRVWAMRLAAGGMIWLWTSTAASMIWVQPIQKTSTDKRIQALESQIREGKGNPGVASELQVLKITRDLTPYLMVASAFIFSIYPTLSLILLNTVGAREACARPSLPLIEP